jgi:glyoxylase I family protein
MSSLHFSHMAITCKDPLAIEWFYTRYFGFKRARVVMPGAEQIVFMKKGSVYLEIFQAKKDGTVLPAEGTGPEYAGWRHIAFQVDDIDVMLAKIGEAARITLGPLDFDSIIPGWRTVWLADPEGNIVEISQGYVDQENPPQL